MAIEVVLPRLNSYDFFTFCSHATIHGKWTR